MHTTHPHPTLPTDPAHIIKFKAVPAMLSSSHPGEFAELHTGLWMACLRVHRQVWASENTAWIEGVWLTVPKQNSPSSQNKVAPPRQSHQCRIQASGDTGQEQPASDSGCFCDDRIRSRRMGGLRGWELARTGNPGKPAVALLRGTGGRCPEPPYGTLALSNTCFLPNSTEL